MAGTDRATGTAEPVRRELTFEDVLRWQGMSRMVERRLEAEGAREGEACAPPADSAPHRFRRFDSQLVPLPCTAPRFSAALRARVISRPNSFITR